MIKALIVDDHQLFAEGLRSLFSSEEDISITHYTDNGHEVPTLLHEHPVDIVLLDMSMPKLDGPGVLQLLQEQGIKVPVLILTMHSGFKSLRKALSYGIGGYILKDASKAQLLEAIQQVSSGQNYFDAQVQQQMLDYFRGKKPEHDGLTELSEREMEIVRELATGGSSKAISERLFLSEHTVRTHRRNILQKLGLHNTAELIHMAMEKGWI